MKFTPFVLFVALLFPCLAHAVTPEEQNGCDDSPDVKSAEEVCAVYKKLEGYYGRYNIITPGTRDSSLYAKEPDLCRAYYTTYMRGRNIICSYQKEAKVLAAKLTKRPPLPKPGDPPLSQTQVDELLAAGENYKAAKTMHKKYLDLLTGNEADEKKYYSMFGLTVNVAGFGGESQGKDNRDQMMFFLLNTEKNCKGGSISNIPALWWGGVNKAHGELLKQTHPRIVKAVGYAKKIADQAVNTWDGLEKATYAAAGSLGNTGTPGSPDVTHPKPKEEPKLPTELPIPVDVGGGLIVDKVGEILLELTHVAPGPTAIVSFLVSLGYSQATSGHVGTRDIIAAAVGLVSMPMGLLATVMNAVISRDEAHRAVYTLWSQKALNANEKLKPQELSQEFCKWYEEEEKKQQQESVAEALKKAQTPGGRLGDPGMPGSPGNTD